MQIKSLRIKSYRSFRIDDTTPADAFERLRKIETYRALRAEGCSEPTALRAIGWSRAQEWAVWRMRKKVPFMGKKRLKGMLAREEIALSESTLGRILAKGVGLGRITPCAFCRRRVTAKKRRTFAKGHAQRWTVGAKAARPGEWIQIDHMSVSRDGDTDKEFKATCPIGKQRVVRVYSRATAGNARRFLQALRAANSLGKRASSPRRPSPKDFSTDWRKPKPRVLPISQE